jgi:Cu-processing system ATP-binding protein
MESLRGKSERKEELIKLFRVEKDLNKSLRKLSGGTLQKVNLINCLMYDRPLIVLDEPTVGLDPVSLIRLKNLLISESKRGKLILVSTHIMDFAGSLASEIIFLLEGNVYFNGKVSLLFEQTNAESMEQAVANLLERNNV